VNSTSSYTTPVLGGTTSYSVTCGSIGAETSQASNGTASVQCGTAGAEIFFNVQNNTSDYIIVTKVSSNCATAGSRTIKILYRTNSYVGNDASATGWTSVYNVTGAVVAGLNTFTLPSTFSIPPGGIYGMVIYTSDRWLFLNNSGTTVGPDINLIQGAYLCAQANPLLAASVPGAQFAGSIFYKLSCQSPTVVCSALNTCALPVELLRFTANYEKDNQRVMLNWATASETNCDYFSIEHTVDGIHFEKVGENIAGHGTTGEEHEYSLTDYNPFGGVSYYRLKQNDLDGRFTYSNLEMVSINAENSIFTVKPNPTTSNAEITYNCNTSELAHLKVYDSRGRLVISKELNCAKGQNSYTIDLEKEQNGLFYITLTVSDNIYKSKLIKGN
jgi:hypothetical protein